MDERLPWFSAMPPEQRSWVGLVAQAGIAAFVEWYRRPDAEPGVGGEVFGTAPRELTRAVSLQQTVELVRVTIEVVEEEVEALAAPGHEAQLREAVLRFSREVAFAAAQVYASAAEQRGAWDARLEALVVDGLLRGDGEDTPSRAAALGWRAPPAVAVAVGAPASTEVEVVLDDVHHIARAAGIQMLASVHADRLVLVLGTDTEPVDVVPSLLPGFGPGPVVVGSTVPDLSGAAVSAAAAIAGLRAAPAWPGAPRPVRADQLLPERAFDGDVEARRALVENVYRALVDTDVVLLDTVASYLEHGGSLEATARAMFLHPNTVRYRLRKAAGACGLSPAVARDALTLQVALALGRIADADAAL